MMMDGGGARLKASKMELAVPRLKSTEMTRAVVPRVLLPSPVSFLCFHSFSPFLSWPSLFFSHKPLLFPSAQDLFIRYHFLPLFFVVLLLCFSSQIFRPPFLVAEAPSSIRPSPRTSRPSTLLVPHRNPQTPFFSLFFIQPSLAETFPCFSFSFPCFAF